MSQVRVTKVSACQLLIRCLLVIMYYTEVTDIHSLVDMNQQPKRMCDLLWSVYTNTGQKENPHNILPVATPFELSMMDFLLKPIAETQSLL